MNNKVLIYVDKTDYISEYRKAGVSAFLFALKDYCVGYENTYTLDEIIKVDVSNKYILINRLLDCNDVDNLKVLLKDIKDIKGIVYEDISVYRIVKGLGLDVELIFFQNHFATNTYSVNFWLDRVDSLLLSNEITKDEIKYILDNAKKELCVHVFGYNQVMYSRRLLLSNWSEEFNIPFIDKNVLEEVVTKIKFRAIENKYGTVMYSENIFNGLDLLKLNNIKYGYFNTTFLSHDTVMKVLETGEFDGGDDGFLNKETIYKLKEVNK